MPVRAILLAALLAVVLPGCAAAPSAAESAAAAAPAGNPPPPLTRLETDFLIQMTMHGWAVLETSRLARDRAEAPAIRRYAEEVFQEQEAQNRALGALTRLQRVHIDLAEDDEHQNFQARLMGMSGSAFDHDYMREQVVDHTTMLQLLQWEVEHGQAGPLRDLARQALPTQRERLRAAQALELPA